MFSVNPDRRPPRTPKDYRNMIQRSERDHVLWCQDRVTLAVYHKRPSAEIGNLLHLLREAIQGKAS